MATYQHLPLQRIEGELERRKRPGFGPSSGRDSSVHGPKIGGEIDRVIDRQKRRPKIADIDPAFILKVTTVSNVSEDEWAKMGLTVLAIEPDKTIILFANDIELEAFKQKVEAYNGEKPEGQKNAPYAGLIDAIETVGELTGEDRIGPILRDEGYDTPNSFSDAFETLDVELWPVRGFAADVFVHRVTAALEQSGGTAISVYRGRSALLMRIGGGGQAIRALLDLPEVASIDRPPEPDWPELAASDITVGSVPPPNAADADAATIGIIDSGLSSEHPFLVGSVVGSFGEPANLGDDDAKGHGTPVTGVAVYGDLRQKITTTPFQARFRIASARVVNAEGRFDDEELVPTQMENSIRRLHDEFGCRVINISLGDVKRPAGPKASAWASVLDDLARELDIVIVVSAGNSSGAPLGRLGDGIVSAFPDFILEASNRILEPASAVNVLTVGSLTHSNGLADADADNVGVLAIAQAFQPSPFTRVGPGSNNAIKPDLVDFGGTLVFDGPTQRLQDGSNRANAGILSTNSDYLRQLLTFRSGTSFAAPLVAYKAALLIEAFPNATSNLVRALLALSAEHPESALKCLPAGNDDAVFNVLGYGLADVEKALASEDNRVILFREDTLGPDKFAVYEIPIPEIFQTGKESRQIRVALSFDPPVRHTRVDYAGNKMGFHLLRGTNAQEVFDAFRIWEKEEGEAVTIANGLKCDMKPGAQRRERGTLQCSTFVAHRNIAKYGGSYFLAVRCESGWSAEDQRFAVAVELRAHADIPLYQRIQERVRVRV
jgi:subtilisin family serine protease